MPLGVGGGFQGCLFGRQLGGSSVRLRLAGLEALVECREDVFFSCSCFRGSLGGASF